MKKNNLVLSKLLFSVCLLSIFCGSGCKHRPSKVEVMRQEKAQRDSLNYVHNQHTIVYSDSVLAVRMPQADSLLRFFRYEKDEEAEDHGHYVHRLLQTTSNTSRCFLQAYVGDDHRTILKSYYFGKQKHNQHALKISVDDIYREHEGSNYSFDTEGHHEILTIMDDDAVSLLEFIAQHRNERIRVSSVGNLSVQYYLTDSEKQALADTYLLGAVMRDINQMERAIRVSQAKIQKYEKKHANKQ